MTYKFSSRHSLARARQRGITSPQIDAVERHADIERRRGGRCIAIWISKKKLQHFGPATPEGVSTDRLHGLVVLLSEDQVRVTVIRNRRSTIYRRNVGSKR